MADVGGRRSVGRARHIVNAVRKDIGNNHIAARDIGDVAGNLVKYCLQVSRGRRFVEFTGIRGHCRQYVNRQRISGRGFGYVARQPDGVYSRPCQLGRSRLVYGVISARVGGSRSICTYVTACRPIGQPIGENNHHLYRVGPAVCSQLRLSKVHRLTDVGKVSGRQPVNIGFDRIKIVGERIVKRGRG